MATVQKLQNTAQTTPPPAITFLQRDRQIANARGSILYHVFVITLGALMLYPIAWLFASSLKGPDEVWTNINSLIPKNIRLENYLEGWQGFGGVTFLTFFKNSFIYAGFTTLFSVTTSAVVAYAFARIRFVGRNFWFAIMLMTLMIPTQVLIIPQYIIFNKIGWTNTFLPLLIPQLGGNAFFIFMIVQFIRAIPIRSDEAALIDGADKGGVFFRIILPQITPALVTAAIFAFYWTWEDFLLPLVYLNTNDLYTVSVALKSFSDPAGITNWGAVFAMLGLSLVPVFLIFIFFQRYIVEGIATTGLKGLIRVSMREQAERWANFVVINLLWSLFAIPIVTLPAATAGVFAVMSRRIRNRPLRIFDEFFGTMRRLWLKATAIALVNVLLCGLLVANLLIFRLMTTIDILGFLARSVTFFAAIALLLTNLYVWPLMVVSDLPLRQLVEVSWKLMIAHPLWSCGVLIGAAVPTVLSLMLPRGVFLFITVSASILIITMGTWPIIRQHIPEEALTYL